MDDNSQKRMRIGPFAWLPIGIGLGILLGLAMSNMEVGVGAGLVFGGAMMAITGRRAKAKQMAAEHADAAELEETDVEDEDADTAEEALPPA